MAGCGGGGFDVRRRRVSGRPVVPGLARLYLRCVPAGGHACFVAMAVAGPSGRWQAKTVSLSSPQRHGMSLGGLAAVATAAVVSPPLR